MSTRFCKCGQVVGRDGCGTCRKPRKQVEYKTTTQRGYGGDWQQLSERYRANYPLCEDCLKQGKVTPSSEVHHIVPIAVDPTQRLTWTNLVALCNTCHDGRHRQN
jgi:5-methylcytosine-specific restriction endonuclease McrA